MNVRFNCNIGNCSAKFDKALELRGHLAFVHQDWLPYRCSICTNYNASTENAIFQHFKKSHSRYQDITPTNTPFCEMQYNPEKIQNLDRMFELCVKAGPVPDKKNQNSKNSKEIVINWVPSIDIYDDSRVKQGIVNDNRDSKAVLIFEEEKTNQDPVSSIMSRKNHIIKLEDPDLDNTDIGSMPKSSIDEQIAKIQQMPKKVHNKSLIRGRIGKRTGTDKQGEMMGNSGEKKVTTISEVRSAITMYQDPESSEANSFDDNRVKQEIINGNHNNKTVAICEEEKTYEDPVSASRDIIKVEELDLDNTDIGSMKKDTKSKIQHKSAEISRQLQEVFGDSALSRVSIYKWIERINAGCDSLEDAPRSGRPSTEFTAKNVNFAREIMDSDCRLSVKDLAGILGVSFGTAHSILHDGLGMTKVSAGWVPKLPVPRIKAFRRQSRAEISPAKQEKICGKKDQQKPSNEPKENKNAKRKIRQKISKASIVSPSTAASSSCSNHQSDQSDDTNNQEDSDLETMNVGKTRSRRVYTRPAQEKLSTEIAETTTRLEYFDEISKNRPLSIGEQKERINLQKTSTNLAKQLHRQKSYVTASRKFYAKRRRLLEKAVERGLDTEDGTVSRFVRTRRGVKNPELQQAKAVFSRRTKGV